MLGHAASVAATMNVLMWPAPTTSRRDASFRASHFTPSAAAAPVRRPVIAPAFRSASGAPVASSHRSVVPKTSGSPRLGLPENHAVSFRPNRPLPASSPERMSMSATPGSNCSYTMGHAVASPSAFWR